MLEPFPASLIEGVLRKRPEDGARRGVLRRRLVTVRPGRQGPRPPGTTTWVRGARCNRSGANAGEASAAPEPKIATVERREASVPRHGTQGASLGAWRAALCARRTGVPPSTRTFLGAPPTLIRGERSKVANPGRRNAPRERDGLFDMVNCEVRDARPHPEERARRRRSANFERTCARLEG